MPSLAVPGTALADPTWLATQLSALARTWRCEDRRVIGTLWWYMASSTLLEQPLRDLVHGRPPADPTLARTTCTIRPDGSLENVTFAATVDGPAAFAVAIRDTLTSVIGAVTAASDAPTPSLWAVATDALGNRALDGSREKGPDLAIRLATAIGSELPTPRFVHVGNSPFVRRASCCLIYETERADKCSSCPRRTPTDRAGLLAAVARRGR